MELGIVGLPNVGKSTLFNALAETEVPSENYPFCTVDPNVGVVPVPDKRLENLGEWIDTETVTPARVTFKDIAGLVENAHEGEGLGNQFLSQIRNVDALCHVLRLFSASDVTHVQGGINPIRDIEIIEAEFALADIGVLEGPLNEAEKEARLGEDDATERYEVLNEVQSKLNKGEHVELEYYNERERQIIQEYPILSTKPLMYVLNVDESILEDPDSNDSYRRTVEYIESETSHNYITLSAHFEQELLEMGPEERELFLSDYGLEEPGLPRLIQSAYDLLDLVTFFTYNENELRAWSIEEGAPAIEAAGKIHTDFMEGFIQAEVINYEQFKEHQSWKSARDDGAVRSRGEDYVVEDGDILQVHAQP